MITAAQQQAFEAWFETRNEAQFTRRSMCDAFAAGSDYQHAIDAQFILPLEPTCRPEDLLWDKIAVADYLHYAPRTLERVGKKPGFPHPARPGKPLLWRAGDIIDWVNAYVAAGSAPSRKASSAALSPQTAPAAPSPPPQTAPAVEFAPPASTADTPPGPSRSPSPATTPDFP
jgi:hypothetical protein